MQPFSMQARSWPPEDRVAKPRSRAAVLATTNLVLIIVCLWLAFGVRPLRGAALVALVVLVVYLVLFHGLLFEIDRATRAAFDAEAPPRKDRTTAAAAAARCARAFTLTALLPPTRWAYGPTLQWWWGMALEASGDREAAVAHLARALPDSPQIHRGWHHVLVNASNLIELQVERGAFDDARSALATALQVVRRDQPFDMPRVRAWGAITQARIEGTAVDASRMQACFAEVPPETWADPVVRAAAAVVRAQVARAHDDVDGLWSALDDALEPGAQPQQHIHALRMMIDAVVEHPQHGRAVHAAQRVRAAVEAGLDAAGLEAHLPVLMIVLLASEDLPTAFSLLDTPGPHQGTAWWNGLRRRTATMAIFMCFPGPWARAEPSAVLVGDDEDLARAHASTHLAEVLSSAPAIRRHAGAARLLAVLGEDAPERPQVRWGWSYFRSEALADLGRFDAAADAVDDAIEAWIAAEMPASEGGEDAARPPADGGGLDGSTRPLQHLVLQCGLRTRRTTRAEAAALLGDRSFVERHRAALLANDVVDVRLGDPSRFAYWESLLLLHDGDLDATRAALAEAIAGHRGDEDPERGEIEVRWLWTRLAHNLGFDDVVREQAATLVPMLERNGYGAFAVELAALVGER
jgi:hypothetical protein